MKNIFKLYYPNYKITSISSVFLTKKTIWSNRIGWNDVNINLSSDFDNCLKKFKDEKVSTVQIELTNKDFPNNKVYSDFLINELI